MSCWNPLNKQTPESIESNPMNDEAQDTPHDANETLDDQQAEQQLGVDETEDAVSAAPATEQGRRMVLVVSAIALLLIATVASLYLSGRGALSPDERFDLAMTAVRDRNAPLVVEQTRELEQVAGYEDKLHVLKGYISLYIDDFETAMLELELAMEHEDDAVKAAAFALAGELMYKLANYGEALPLLMNAIQLDPGYQNAHRLLGGLYYDTGLMQEAIIHLAQTAQLAPEDATPHRLMGLIHKDYEKYQDAIRDYREALTRDPFHTERENVLVEMAESQIQLLRYEPAINTLKLALDSAKVHALRADCLRQLNRLPEARQQLELSLAGNPTQFEALLLKGTLQLEDKDLADARKTLELAVNLFPQDDKCRYKLIEVYRELDEDELVEKHLAVYEPLRAKRLRFSELNVEAIQQPDDIELRYELGILARDLGKRRIAITWFQAVMKMEPGHENSARALQEIQQELSQTP